MRVIAGCTFFAKGVGKFGSGKLFCGWVGRSVASFFAQKVQQQCLEKGFKSIANPIKKPLNTERLKFNAFRSCRPCLELAAFDLISGGRAKQATAEEDEEEQKNENENEKNKEKRRRRKRRG